MKKVTKKKWILFILSLTASLLLGGCGENKKNVYEQAGKDLNQEFYEYALEGYQEVIAAGELLPQAYRGAGIASLRLGNYEDAIRYFHNALAFEKLPKSFCKDVISYRATAYLKGKQYDKALLDCQTLSEEFAMDANSWFLTGMVALEMDSYDQAASGFSQAYDINSTYDMAIRIYQVYVEKEMEADGTKYLEAALNNEPKTAEDYFDRGKVYYYMEDYEQAKKELTAAANQNHSEALLLLGMVYLGQKDISNARSMYTEYAAQEGASAKGYNGLAQCDIAEEKYADALENIAKGLEIASTEEMQDLLYNEIVVYEEQLDFVTAEEKAHKYLALFPNDEKVGREMTFLQSRIKNRIPEEAGDQEEVWEYDPKVFDYSEYDFSSNYNSEEEDYNN